MLIKLIALLGDDESIDLYYEDIAKLIGCSPKTVQRAKKQLVDVGYIEVMQNNGSKGSIGRSESTFKVKLHQIKVDIDDRVLYLPKV